MFTHNIHLFIAISFLVCLLDFSVFSASTLRSCGYIAPKHFYFLILSRRSSCRAHVSILYNLSISRNLLVFKWRAWNSAASKYKSKYWSFTFTYLKFQKKKKKPVKLLFIINLKWKNISDSKHGLRLLDTAVFKQMRNACINCGNKFSSHPHKCISDQETKSLRTIQKKLHKIKRPLLCNA